MTKKWKVSVNAPLIIGLAATAALVLLLDSLSGGSVNRMLAARFTSWSDLLMYPRLVLHVLAHQNLAHFTANFILILAIGPLVEEKYGSGRLAMMMLVTAFATGLIAVFFNVSLIGASGLVFMLILLASFANARNGTIPLTFILVALVYIGNEVVTGIIATDNVSQLAHIVGGLCGSCFGFTAQGRWCDFQK